VEAENAEILGGFEPLGTGAARIASPVAGIPQLPKKGS
jgi:hypothetical protein